jgi:putative transport protein
VRISKYAHKPRAGDDAAQAWTVLARGDVLRAVGAAADIARAADHLGFVERDAARTDLGFLAAGISLGILLGALQFTAYGVPLGLGTAGAILLVGLAAGWARGRYPVFGAVPEPAQRILCDLGLMVFVAIIGLTAGPHAVRALEQNGLPYFASIFLAGAIVTIVPLACGTIFARSVLKMSPLMVLGGIAGAQTCPPGLTALREASGSNVAALAYTIPYAIGYIVITMWGPVIVAVIHAMQR